MTITKKDARWQAGASENGTDASYLVSAADAITTFTGALHEPADLIEVRAIHGQTRAARTVGYCRAEGLPNHVAELARLNGDGWNIFASLNPRRGRERGDKAVLLARCLFADFDGIAPDEALANAIVVALPVPTLLIASGHGTHAYWRLAAPIPPQFWGEWQRDLAALLGADPACCNPERVMRLPGFLNVKAEPVECAIVDADPSRCYDLADLPIPMRAGSDTPRPVFAVRHAADPSSEGDRVRRCRAYLAKLPAAIAGAGGHRATFRAASECVRFGLSEAEALALLAEFNARCDPPWSEGELRHKFKDAYQRNVGQHGSKLAQQRDRAQVRCVHFRGGRAVA